MRATSHAHSPRKSAPMDDFLATRQFEADFSACGEIEFDEIDDPELDTEMSFLAERVRATRDFGA